jgi:hypothetical protein
MITDKIQYDHDIYIYISTRGIIWVKPLNAVAKYIKGPDCGIASRPEPQSHPHHDASISKPCVPKTPWSHFSTLAEQRSLS